MNYINTLTGKYPLRTGGIRAENPNVSFSEVFTPPDHYQPVHTVEKPSFDEFTEKVEELAPVYAEDKWVQVWQAVSLFVEYADDDGVVHTVQEQIDAYRENKKQILAAKVRSERNDKLTKSDWTQVLDAPIDQQAWATYRQALRDITQQVDFPLSVQWPQEPAAQ